MLVLSTKPLQKLTGTGGQTGRRAGKPMCREAAPPKIEMEIHTLQTFRIINVDYTDLLKFDLCEALKYIS